jgi:hypothetical protein
MLDFFISYCIVFPSLFNNIINWVYSELIFILLFFISFLYYLTFQLSGCPSGLFRLDMGFYSNPGFSNRILKIQYRSLKLNSLMGHPDNEGVQSLRQ